MDITPNLLLVDDEKLFVKSLEKILTHYGYSCTTALNGSEAISCLTNTVFDVALLDVGLPDISGCEVAEFRQTSCRQTTAVMLTGLNTVDTAVQAMKNGAYDFLSKPIDHDLLIKTIDKALEHNSLKKELQASENRCRTLAEVAWEGIAIQQNNVLLEANTQFYTLFDYKEKELDRDNFLETILSPESRKLAAATLKQQQSSGCRLTGIRRDQTTFPIQARHCTIEYLGKPAQALIIRDISDQIKREKEKLALQKKLSKASKLNALGMMAGSVAHDLNNILTAIVSYPDLMLARMEPSNPYYIDIQKIQAAGKHAAAIVSDLVSITRSGECTTTVSDLNEVISDHLTSIEHSERLQSFPEIAVKTDLQKGLRHIECAPQQINKLLLNLIGNSLEAIQKNGTIRITTRSTKLSKAIQNDAVDLHPGDYVKLTVADNGPGISCKNIDKIFDPFFSTKKKEKSGTGLGLSIVWNCVQDHKGWIEVKKLDPGLAFEIYFPATDKPRPKSPKSQGSDVNGSPTAHDKTILVVDDQPEQNMVMERMLDTLGYQATSVESGEKAIGYLEDNTVDLVLLDMLMGDGLNGRQTYEEILKIQPALKAVVVSGYSQKEEIENCRQLGISTFLDKPITIPILKEAIENVLPQEKLKTEKPYFSM
ncbi:MAG: response regulator [Desulfopila sp.]